MEISTKQKQIAAFISVGLAVIVIVIGNATRDQVEPEPEPSFAEECESIGPEYSIHEFDRLPGENFVVQHCEYKTPSDEDFRTVSIKKIYD